MISSLHVRSVTSLNYLLMRSLSMSASSWQASSTAKGVEIRGKPINGSQEILTGDALEFIASLHRKFNDTRLELLTQRAKRNERRSAGEKLDFLESTRHVRESSWTINSVPEDLAKRRVEITGPPEIKMIINALNSGADAYMCDFEDSNTPTWENQVIGQVNMKRAVRKTLAFTADNGKEYKLNDKVATLSVRPRGWHLSEKNIFVDGVRTSGSLVDFGLYFFHNAKELISRGTGPYFYLPKMESHLEARLWNDVFIHSQQSLNIPTGTIKATVLIETLLAAFEMEEILYELREHSAGLNAGRWDYIFSIIKCFKHDKNLVLADRGLLTMTTPFMRAYALQLVKSCHKRKAPAIGGMSALIPIKNDPKANEKALQGVRDDKTRDATDGFDGGWVAHPGLVGIAMEEFTKVLGSKVNQIEKQRDDVNVTAKDLLNLVPNSPITEAGLKANISIGIRYLGSWLSGNGCVPIKNLMEDAATAEISRSQVWQWIHSDNGVLQDGRRVTAQMVDGIIAEEVKVLSSEKNAKFYESGAKMFSELVKNETFDDFLTLKPYENL